MSAAVRRKGGNILPGKIGVVFGVFDCLPDGSAAAGDKCLNQFRGGAESRRTFGSVKNSNPSAGSGAEISEASAFLKSRGDQFDGATDVFGFGGDGNRHFLVFAVNQFDNLPAAQQVDIRTGGVALFS